MHGNQLGEFCCSIQAGNYEDWSIIMVGGIEKKGG